MSHAGRRRDRERLERELQTEEYAELLGRLQESAPFLRQFDDWTDVLAFMREGTSEDAANDRVLRPIFRAHAEDHDPRWRSILLAIFWPGLESIYWKKLGWDPDPDDRWQNIVWAFLRVVSRLDVEQRPSRIVQKIINDTINLLHRECRRLWRHADRQTLAEHSQIEAMAGGVEAIGIIAFEIRDARNAQLKRLRDHVEAGRITELDYLLLVGTRMYGQSLAECARQHGNEEKSEKSQI